MVEFDHSTPPSHTCEGWDFFQVEWVFSQVGVGGAWIWVYGVAYMAWVVVSVAAMVAAWPCS